MNRTHSTLLAACLVTFWNAGLLSAAEIHVQTTSDVIAVDGRCSLREAIMVANTDVAFDTCAAGSAEDTIVLTPSTFTIAIAGTGENNNMTGDFDILYHTTIRSSDPSALAVIDAQDIERVFEVHAGAHLTLENVEVRNGDALGFGGCILTLQPESVLTLNNSVVSDCKASLFGGGVFSSGRFHLNDSELSNSEAVLGGNAYIDSTNVLLALRSHIFNGTATADGGGIYGEGNVILDDTRLSNNQADDEGGGIYMQNPAVLVARRSQIEYNRAESHGGGANVTKTQFGQTTLLGNESGANGGGLYFRDGASEASLIENTTVTQNGAEAMGGGLYLDAGSEVSLFNVTISFNAANFNEDGGEDGGGIVNEMGILTVNNSVIANNFAWGNERAPGSEPDCRGTLISNGYNFIGQKGANCTIAGAQTVDIVGTAGPIDPMLNCADDNGGASWTMQPMSQSPLIDAGDPAGCVENSGAAELIVDQRGAPRPFDGPDPDAIATCDIGAFEAFSTSLDPAIFADGFESGNTAAWGGGARSAGKAAKGHPTRGEVNGVNCGENPA